MCIGTLKSLISENQAIVFFNYFNILYAYVAFQASNRVKSTSAQTRGCMWQAKQGRKIEP